MVIAVPYTLTISGDGLEESIKAREIQPCPGEDGLEVCGDVTGIWERGGD